MVANEHAALRLAHPTVVPEEDTAEDDPGEDAVDVTGTHPTVRAATRGD